MRQHELHPFSANDAYLLDVRRRTIALGHAATTIGGAEVCVAGFGGTGPPGGAAAAGEAFAFRDLTIAPDALHDMRLLLRAGQSSPQ